MGNITNDHNWAARERLRRVEMLLWWRGWVGRGDLAEGFGISSAQSSSDLQRYVEMNPDALVYHTSRKRYEGTEGMRCVLHEPRLEEAVLLFHGGEAAPSFAGSRAAAAAGLGKVDIFRPLMRQGTSEVERSVFLAMEQGKKLEVKYASMNGGKAEVREIAPHALGHDGYRWHVRAWCLRNGDYRDFAMSRILSAGWPREAFARAQKDADWERMVEVVLEPHSSLTPEQRKAIEVDYGMKGGSLKVKVREAMREYFLGHCRIPVFDEKGNPRPPHLEERRKA